MTDKAISPLRQRMIGFAPPALQKKSEEVLSLPLEQIHWVLRHEGW
jgi:hypothetical protein